MKAKKIVHVKEEGAKVLLVGDMAGYGKISIGAMIPIMSHMGFNLYNLPTALVSNTLDYGLFEILDTTEYMKNTLKVLEGAGVFLRRHLHGAHSVRGASQGCGGVLPGTAERGQEHLRGSYNGR